MLANWTFSPGNCDASVIINQLQFVSSLYSSAFTTSFFIFILLRICTILYIKLECKLANWIQLNAFKGCCKNYQLLDLYGISTICSFKLLFYSKKTFLDFLIMEIFHTIVCYNLAYCT